MSIELNSSNASFGRSASAPAEGAWAWFSWVYLPTLDGTTWPIFVMRRSGLTEHGHLRWRGDLGTFRCGNSNNPFNFSSNPSGNQWIGFYVRDNGTNITAGWKDIDDVAFIDAGSAASLAEGNNPNAFDCGANVFSTAVPTGVRYFRTTVWNEAVLNANLLLAAATDLGYMTNINTHIPGTATGSARLDDTSGNARHWTGVGTLIDGADPFGGGGPELMGQACL